MDKKDVGRKIKEARQSLSLSQQAVARQLDMTRQGVGHWETGRTFPERKVWAKLEEIFQKPAGWLTSLSYETPQEPPETPNEKLIRLFGDKPPNLTRTISHGWGQAKPADSAMPPVPLNELHSARMVPVYGKVKAGIPNDVEQYIECYISIPDATADDAVVIADGNSMRKPNGDGIHQGDFVLFKFGKEPQHNDVVVVADPYGDAVIRRLKISLNGEFTLVSDAPGYEPITPNGDYIIVGVVRDAWRRVKP